MFSNNLQMKVKQNKKKVRKPAVFVAIGYQEIYDDFDNVRPLEILADIPTSVILKFIAEKYASIFYAQSDIKAQRQHIRDFCQYLPVPIRKKVWRFINRTEKAGNHVFIYGAMGCHMVYRMALQLNNPLDEGDIELCEDEYEPLFKALLYCNSVWTNYQINQDELSIGDLSLKMDIPIAESKHYKDFRPQLFKAHQLFVFCENDATFSTYLPPFYRDRGVNNWAEYIALLCGIYYYTLYSCVLPSGNKYEQQFLSQFVINHQDSELASLWDDGFKGFGYLRNHFLYKLPNDELLVLDTNLLIDKIYQGLKFDLFGTVKRNGLLNANGKKYSDQRDFNATLGDIFSEDHLLYTILNKIYSGGNAIKFTGKELKQRGIVAELDYYLRIGNTLYLIEYKDVLFPDSLRFSDNVNAIKKGLFDRLCRDDGINSRKGAGQLLFNIDRIMNQGLMNSLDPDIANVTNIFPLLITTDSAFSALGVNLTVSEEYDRIKKTKYQFPNTVTIFAPVIANIDSIILLSYRLHTARLQLNELLIDYIKGNWLNISSFDNYVFDECRETEEERSRALRFLLGDIVEKVNQMTQWNNGL